MATSELDKYKVDHLFLLIGENPLPNYVAAKTLLAEGGKPYLVFTEHTEKPAERLMEELALSDSQTVSLVNNEFNAYEIKKRIRAKIQEIKSKFLDRKRFGLNYTGGTKAMSVHAYQALLHPVDEQAETQFNPPVVFSYLDPRNLKILIEQITNPIPFNVPKEQLDLSLEKLFKLHGFTLSKPPKTEVSLPELVDAIFKNYLDWQHWCNTVLAVNAKEKTIIKQIINNNKEKETIIRLKEWKKYQDLKKESFDITGLPNDITTILDLRNLLQNNELSIQQIDSASVLPKSKKKEKNPENICKWLEGVWLEDYVLKQLKKIQIECGIDEIGMSFNFPSGTNNAEFEFDIAFLRGYQLFTISCTTDTTPSLCKLKLFEAYRRARQIGGDEARVALACCSDKPDTIKKNFLAQVNDPKVNVFGYAHLANLSEHLQAWVQEVDA